MKNKIKKGLVGITLSSMVFAGCQKNPDTSIVSNKDFDSMIEQAENTEGETTEVSELADNYDTYQTTIKDDTMHVEVNVDATVDIPETDRLSVYRVEQQPISQELLDKVRTTLLGDIHLYDGAALGVSTKQSVESEINDHKQAIEDVQSDNLLSEEAKQAYIDEYQAVIDGLQEKYESAPDEVPLSDYPSDYQFHSVSALYEADSQNGYYEWQYSLNPTGTIYYGVSDTEDGNYTFIYAQNSEDYGNRLHFRTCKLDYPGRTPVVGTSGFDGNCVDYSYGVWKDGEEPDIDFIIDNNLELEEDTLESASLSEEEARKEAEDFLQEIGLTDYTYYVGGLYNDIYDVASTKEEGVYQYRKEYIFGYRRNISGVFACNEGDAKLTDGYQGDTYVKKFWEGEGVTVIVNDDGIVGFDLCTPLNVTETVVEQANIKSFSEIKDIFEQMVVTINASTEEEDRVKIDVNKVVLRYTRISEPDSFDTGLLVPTWEFIGSVNGIVGDYYYDGSSDDMIVMSINAIDGSVINQELGY